MNAIRKYNCYFFLLETLSILALIYAIFPLFHLREIPNDKLIPIHFDFLGNQNEWRDNTYLIIYPLLSLLFYLLFFIAEFNYKRLNYPIKITQTNREKAYRNSVVLIRHLKFLVVLLIGYLGNTAFYIAIGSLKKGNTIITLSLLLGILLFIILFFIKMLKLRNQ